MSKTTSFTISKNSVWEAYKRVKSNKGAAGIDEQSIEDFEKNLRDNLYKIWNRMPSGSYFPPPVLRVEIPKPDGRMRPLGIPTVSDRIAQMVVKLYLEPELESCFCDDSYGYRPKKSVIDAVSKAKRRCWIKARYPNLFPHWKKFTKVRNANKAEEELRRKVAYLNRYCALQNSA